LIELPFFRLVLRHDDGQAEISDGVWQFEVLCKASSEFQPTQKEPEKEPDIISQILSDSAKVAEDLLKFHPTFGKGTSWVTWESKVAIVEPP
jgi:hypothetical protein